MTRPESSDAAGPLLRWGVEWIALAGFLAFTVVAVIGYAVFALNPQLLPPSPTAIAIYRNSMPFFAQAQIAVAATVLFLVLARRARLRWLPAAAVVYLLSFLSEFVGTGYGVPFGPYGYTEMLGAKLGGRVPWLIPLSWFLMAVPSYRIALHALPAPGWRSGAGRIILAAALLTAWDLALDPAMSFLTTYWVWGEQGAYYGMPAINLGGWIVTGIVLMTVIEGLRGRDWARRLPLRWAVAYYGVMLLMPLGMIVAAGLWLGVGVTFGALAVLGLAVRALSGNGALEPPGPQPLVRPAGSLSAAGREVAS